MSEWNLIEEYTNKTLVSYPTWRRGQTLFNVVADLHPNVAEQIRATTYDCFYDDGKIDIFKTEVIRLLNNGE